MAITFKDVIAAFKDEYGDESPEDVMADTIEDQEPASDGEILHSGNFYVLVVDSEGEYTLIRLDDQSTTTFCSDDGEEISSDIDKFMGLEDEEFEDAFDVWASNFDFMMEGITFMTESERYHGRRWNPHKPDDREGLTIRKFRCEIHYDSTTYLFCKVINHRDWFLIRKSDNRIGHFTGSDLALPSNKAWSWWFAFAKGDGKRMADNAKKSSGEWHDIYFGTVDRHLHKFIKDNEKYVFRDDPNDNEEDRYYK